MIQLDPTDCPACGCNDVTILRAPVPDSWFGSGKARCRHCNKMFSFRLSGAAIRNGNGSGRPELPPEEEPVAAPCLPPEDRGVIYHIVRCPKCGGDRTKIVRTDRPVRYHKCGECGHGFKSVEG